MATRTMLNPAGYVLQAPVGEAGESGGSFDGTVEGAIDLILEPDEPEVTEPDEPEESTEGPDPETEEPEEEEGEDNPDEESEPETEDDEEPETPDESEEPEGELHTVSVDGKEVQVTLEDLKRGYSGQQYVQQGMREAAESRKQAEQAFIALQNERQQIAQFIGQMQQEGFVPPPKEPSPELFNSDPVAYMEARIKYDADKEAFERQNAQLQQIAGRQSQADQAAMEAYLAGELKQLRALEPDFNDAAKAKAVREDMVQVGNEVYGYAAEEIAGITDHRAIRVLMDAMRYRKIVAGKEQAKEKVRTKVAKARVKPKAETSAKSRRRKQRAQLRNSGKLDDAIGLIMES